MTVLRKNIEDFYFVVYDLYDIPILFYENYNELLYEFKIPLKELIRKMNRSRDNYILIRDGVNLRKIHFFV